MTSAAPKTQTNAGANAGGSDLRWTPCTVSLGSLKPWERNPRKMSKRSAERLLRSWRELGQFQTIAIGPDGEVYDGHQRLSALVVAYGVDYQVQALRSNRALNDDERRSLTLQANNPAGVWDWDALATWSTEELARGGFGFESRQCSTGH